MARPWDEAHALDGSTVYRTKRRFVEVNLEAALNEEPRAGGDRKLTSNEEALLVAAACSSLPEGRARWTLLAGAMVKPPTIMFDPKGSAATSAL